MRGMYKFHWECGRMGDLEGVFIADSAEIEELFGKEVSFGEALGKHSEVYGTIDHEDITLLTQDPLVLDALGNLNIGYNPLHYLED